jgi:leucyl aminopeptidase
MKFTTTDQALDQIQVDCLMIGIAQTEDGQTILGPSAQATDQTLAGFISQLIDSGDAHTKAGKTLMVHTPSHPSAKRILLVGMGEDNKRNRIAFKKCIDAAGKALRQSPAKSAHCALTEYAITDADGHWAIRQAALTLVHSDYVYEVTKKPKPDDHPKTEQVSFPEGKGTDTELKIAAGISAGVGLCRDLGDLPPNVCNPPYLAEVAQKMANEHGGLAAEILEEDQMAKLGMNALLAVGQGSASPSKLIHLRWRGGSEGEAPLALVGKGVTFDTGGISIKPGALMEQMKFDMCGAATALGVMKTVATLKLKINLDIVVAAVENMPDGKSYRPGDVITSMSGQTIEVHNTDAEGRMILADALTWTGQNVKPKAMVDIATLTGACVVALGHHASGIMTPDDGLAEELLGAGLEAADRGWRLPLWDEYQEQLDSPFADMKNVGGMPAGSITAGCFLSRFTKDQRWAHIDIAGSAWVWGQAVSASGRPVGLLVQWVANQAGGWSKAIGA